LAAPLAAVVRWTGKELQMVDLSAPAIRARKACNGTDRLVMVTAYDAPSARIVDEAGVDLILVGDSVAMAVLGYDNTLQVTVDDMAHHVAAVARAKPTAHIVADLPWMSYHVSPSETVRNAARLIRCGAQSVKLEGGRKRLPMIECITAAEIPVMGHIGLTPQSTHVMGGFKVQGRTAEAARRLVQAAKSLTHAGCYAIVLEGVPVQVAELVTEAIEIPTIGIGAGPVCDGQVLVFHDLLGFEQQLNPKFVRRYAQLHHSATEAVERFAGDVRSGVFPSEQESYQLPAEEAAELGVINP